MANPELPEVAIDARFLLTGLGTYTFNILKNLNCSSQFRIRVLTRQECIPALKPYFDSFRIVNAGMYSATEQLAVARAARKCDLLHSTHYNMPVLHRGRVLVTIHDLTHLLDRSLRKAFKSIVYAQPLLRFVSSRADHIITVSNYSKHNIVNLLGVPEERVSIIPNGVDEEFYPEPRDMSLRAIQQLIGFEGPYILFLGNLKPHKNVDGLLRAFAILTQSKSFDHKLLIVGEDALGGLVLIKTAKELRLDGRVVFAPRLEQQYLRAVYCGASMTVLPSFEEGFGLPVLESMACGTPVACSNAASMPETVGDAGEYFDPHSPESISDSISRVLSSSNLRDEMRNRGLKRASNFSWKVSAQGHLALYKKLTA